MRNWGQIFIGTLIVIAGLIFLIGAVFDVEAEPFCLPIGLIALGVFLLLRPRLAAPGTGFQLKLLGDVRRHGAWQVADEEIWVGVGDVRLDVTEADVPRGESLIRVFGFVGSVRLTVPENVGLSLSSIAFVTDAKVLGRKYSRVLTPFYITTEGYESAERKIRLEVTRFVGDITVKRAPAQEAQIP